MVIICKHQTIIYLGSGCPKCGRLSSSSTKLKEGGIKFFQKVNDVHGDIYDYSLFIYNGLHVNSSIICKKHGVFNQSPVSHLNGSGCPDCAHYGYSNNKEGYIYILVISNGNIKFIGYGKTNYIERRIKQHINKLHKQGYSILEKYIFKMDSGTHASIIETKIKNDLPSIKSNIIGFKRENTQFSNLDAILNIIGN